MARARYTKRIFFKTLTGIHSFYWVSMGNDRSIYFGSSVASKHSKFGFKKSSDVPQEGIVLDENNFERMEREELSGKYSLHRSGIVNTPSERNRYQISDLDSYGDDIPLVGLLPMKPDRYPLFTKKTSQDDVVLLLNIFLNQPFALLIFVSKNEAPFFAGLESEEWCYREKYISPFDSLNLCIYMYAKSSGFEVWPLHEMEIFMKNNEIEEQLAYPIVSKLPDEVYWRNFR